MTKHKPQLLAHIDQIEHEVLTYMDLLIKCTPDDRAFVMPVVKPLPSLTQPLYSPSSE